MTDDNERKTSIENDPERNTDEGSGEASQRYGISYTPGQSGYSNSTYGAYPGGNSQESNDPPKKKANGNKKALAVSIIAICAVILVAVLMIGTYMTVNSLAGILEKYRESEITDGTEGTSGGSSHKPNTSGGNVIVYKSDNASPATTDFTETVAKVEKSVVEINTETVIYQKYYGNYIQSGAGSGVIIGSDEEKKTYYVITNHHVVDSANTILVRLYDGSEYNAALVASDEISDIAIVAIIESEGKELSVAAYGDSSELRNGQDIFAIGNPLGQLGGSVIKGIISKTERHISVSGIRMSLLQIDASVNPGNSGGGLFDMAGNLIGIVNAKSSGDNVDGLGFAIPINTAVEVANELLENGYVSGRLGFGTVISDAVSNSVTYAMVTSPNGVTGTYTDNNGKTQTFTFEENDIVLKVGNAEVSGAASLISILSEYNAGDKVELTVYRVKRQSIGFGYSTTYTEEYQVTVGLIEYKD